MTTTCPEDGKLKQMVSGVLPETEELQIVRHLDECPGCQVRIEKIAVGNTSIMEAARSAKLDTPPEVRSAFWPALKKIEMDLDTPMPEAASLKEEESEVSATVTSVTPIHHVDSSGLRPKAYSFLEPAEEPEYLGQIDRFKIVELVGKGGMGMVFRAFDACLQRTVAVKVLDPQYATNEQAQGRFCREARAAAGVTHENVVTIHHVEHVEERDLSFIVMQFVKGRSLQDLLDQHGPLPVREAVRIAAATASGLAAAHANGLIHRDIKPGNILIEQTTNRVLLTDFGLARLNEDVKITQTGFVAGTPLYMSPEQARGDQLTASSDLFSLGGVLYAMLTGNPPFQGSSAFVVLRQVTESRHRSVQDANSSVPASIAEIVDRLLEKTAKNRFKDAAEVAVILNSELAKLPADQPQTVTRRSSFFVPAYARSWWRRYSPVAASVLIGGLGLLAVLEATKTTKFTLLGQRGLTRLTAAENPAPKEEEIPPLYVLKGQDGAIWSVAFDSKSELLATASEGGMVKFVSARDGRELGVLNNMKYKSPVWTISFNKDSSRLLTASDDGHVRIWDVKSKELISDIDHPFPVRCAIFSPDGTKIVSGTRDGIVTIWDAETQKPLQSIKAHAGSIIMSLAFSPDGKLVASAGSDKTVRVWHVKDGMPYTTFTGHVGPVYAVAFSPDNKVLASAGWDHTLKLYDIEKREPKESYDSIHEEDIWALSFSPDGKHIVTAGQDRTARWVETATGKVVKIFRGHGGPVHGVVVSRDGSLIATSGRDGSVRVWNPE
ncbi:WD40 repeat domain-containing serine/threonine protein kinase [Zavarzinella formosa]|uniref:WD40 repeat domain-containing serine/threonine protein kinase n=1 Tax=Zavarzinella formosa TaxID=360055 RepID=UPI00036BE7F8|nr:serine/threonine-protein kinase [Zavarzinella formosa]